MTEAALARLNESGTKQLANVEIHVYETAGREGIDNVAITLEGITDELGNEISAVNMNLTDISGNPITDWSINPADGEIYVATLELPGDLPTGLYTALIRTTVQSENLNANLDQVLTAAGLPSVGMWVYPEDNSYSYIAPVVIASDVETIAPPTDVVYDCSASGVLEVSGKLPDAETLRYCL